MKLLCFSTLALLSLSTQAQDVLIKYDLINQKSEYYKISGRDTIKTKDLQLKKNSRLFLAVDNCNPYAWDVKVTSYATPIAEDISYGNVFNPFTSVFSGTSGILGGLSGLFQSEPILNSSGSEFPEIKAGGIFQSTNGGNAAFMQAQSQYANAASEFKELYTKVFALTEGIKSVQIANVQLKELKIDPTKTEKEIKESAVEILQTAGFEPEEADPKKLLTYGMKLDEELDKSIKDLTKKYGLLKLLVENYSTLSANIQGDTPLSDLSESFEEIEELKEKKAAKNNYVINEFVELGSTFQQIQKANFQYLFTTYNDGEISDIKLQLYSKLKKEEEEPVDTLVQFFNLRKRATVKIRNSAGVAFTSFGAHNRSYTIDDNGVITQGKGDLFRPIIATFVHFYQGKQYGVKWGGGFGVGIPLDGEEKSVNFLLELTAAFGRNEPVMVTAGVSGAKVNKLNSGIKVGDITTFQSPENIVTQGYDLGAFLSITLNLSGLGIR